MSEARIYSATLQDPVHGATVLDVHAGNVAEAFTAARNALHIADGDMGYVVEEGHDLFLIYPDVAEASLDNPRRVVVRKL